MDCRLPMCVAACLLLVGMTAADALASSWTPGDANCDGRVDRLDAALLASHWLRSGSWTWTDGDFNGDGRINDLDASILAAHWCYAAPEPPSNHNPEPASLIVWAVVTACAVAGVRWRSRRVPR